MSLPIGPTRDFTHHAARATATPIDINTEAPAARTSAASDLLPETYVMALAAVLSCHPQPVVYRVTDPRSGLTGRSQWLPTAAEVKAACEAEMTPLREAVQRRAVTERNRIIFTSGPGHDRRAAMERLRSEFPGMFDRSNEKVCFAILCAGHSCGDAEIRNWLGQDRATLHVP
jgi:hypothetical protein